MSGCHDHACSLSGGLDEVDVTLLYTAVGSVHSQTLSTLSILLSGSAVLELPELLLYSQ